MNKMTLLEHFRELKQRLIYVLICFCVSFILGYIISPYIRDLLLIPLIKTWKSGILTYVNLTDGFFIKLSLASLCAFFTTIPYFLYQVYKFIAPGLLKNEKSFVKPILIISPLLFLMGAVFVYYILLPLVFQFFISESENASAIQIVLLPNLSNYLNLTIKFIKIFGLAFQFPLILVLLNRVGLLNPNSLKKQRRFIIVGVFIISAILTPPDIISMIILAIPLILMFEISLYFMKPIKNC